jgi:AcrR family transcriptional regulator
LSAIPNEPAPSRRRRWTAVPPADRVKQRRDLLVQAGFDILGREGWSSLTIRSVIERADLNVRYFYESFSDVDSLAVAVYDKVVDDLGAVVLAALEYAGGDPAAGARAVVRGIVEFVDEDRRRGRVLYIEGLGSEALNRRRLQAGQAVAVFIEQYAAQQNPTPPPEDPIGRVGGSIVVGGFSQLLTDWLAGRIPLGRDEFIDDATDMLLAVGAGAAAVAARRTGDRRPRASRPSSRLEPANGSSKTTTKSTRKARP